MAKSPVLTVANWDRFQHYKDRCPPWIKLATDTFQNYDFGRLHDASKLLALCIWTLAARTSDGSVPADFGWIKRQGNLSDFVQLEHLKELIDNGYLVDASNTLASCYPSRARGEAEGEAETEGEREVGCATKNVKPTEPVEQKDAPDDKPAKPSKPVNSPRQLGRFLAEIGANDKTCPNIILSRASCNGINPQQLDREWGKFCNYFLGKGTPWKDWGRAWDNWLTRAAIGSPQRGGDGQRPDRLTAILGASMATAMQRNGLAGGERPREDGGDFGADTGSDEAHLLPLAASS